MGTAQRYCIRLMVLGLALASQGGRVASAAETASGGDKIQFSGAADAVPLPEGDDSSPLAGSMELLQKGNSLGGAMDRPAGLPPAGVSQRKLSARLLELLDRERNWVLKSPEDMNQMRTAEEVMQIWEYDLDRALGLPGASGTPAERRAPAQPAAPKPLHPDESDSAFLLDNRFDIGPAAHSGPNAGGWLNAAPALQPLPLTPLAQTQSQPASESSGASLRLTTSDLFPSLLRERVAPDIRELLVSPDALNPLLTSRDPINLETDSTRREINPVTSSSLNDLRTRSAQDTAFVAPAASGTGNARPTTVLEDMTAKILGPSSLSPALLVPVETPKAKPKQNLRESFGRKL